MLTELESLILRDNYLPTLKEGVFKQFVVNENGRENNTILDVRHNPFTCNCSMEWMRNIKLKIELQIHQLIDNQLIYQICATQNIKMNIMLII